MPPLAPEGEFDVTIKHRFTLSVGSKSHECCPESHSQETERATLNGCKYITLPVLQLSVCRGGNLGYYDVCLLCISHPLDLAAIFPVSKINIWASALPESLTFYSSALLYIQEVSDTESLSLLCSSTTEAARLSKVSLFHSVSVLKYGARCWNLKSGAWKFVNPWEFSLFLHRPEVLNLDIGKPIKTVRQKVS